jgi:hypothetical protein
MTHDGAVSRFFPSFRSPSGLNGVLCVFCVVYACVCWGRGKQLCGLQVKFNVNRSDNMIIQSISLLDQVQWLVWLVWLGLGLALRACL